MTTSTPPARQLWSLELIWWICTFILVLLILFPIYNRGLAYPFYHYNVVAIVAFITFTRYIFLLDHTPFARSQLTKAALIFLIIPVLFFIGQGINYLQTYLDENGPEVLVGLLPKEEQESVLSYIRSQMFFFGVGAIVAGLAIPIRMIASIWQQHNRG
jgi:hypothetical protein